MAEKQKRLDGTGETHSELVGFVRKSKNGKALNLSLAVDVMPSLETYKSKNGEDYYPLIINLEKLMDLISEQRDFVTVNQLQTKGD